MGSNSAITMSLKVLPKQQKVRSLNDQLVGLTAQSACVGVSALMILFHSCLPASVPECSESATCAGSILMLTGAVVAVLNVTGRAAPVVARVALTAWRRGGEAHCKCSVESNKD